MLWHGRRGEGLVDADELRYTAECLGAGGVHGAPVGGVDQTGHLFAVDRLFLEQCLGDRVEPLAVFGEDRHGPLLLLAQDPLDLLVDHTGGHVGVVAGVHEVLAEEHRTAIGAPSHRPHPLGHAELPDHLSGHLGGALQVVGCASRERIEHEALGTAPPHEHDESVLDVLPPVGMALFDRELLGDAEGHPGGQDRDLVNRVGLG